MLSPDFFTRFLMLKDRTSWGFKFDQPLPRWQAEFIRILGLSGSADKITNEISFAESALPASSFVSARLVQQNNAFRWSIDDPRSSLIWLQDVPPPVHCIAAKSDGSDLYQMLSVALLPVMQTAVAKGGMVFHSAVSEHAQKAVLFAGYGGAGKSTTASRLPKEWRSLCDDEALAVKIGEHEWAMHPLPTWSDFTVRRLYDRKWDVAETFPLHAVFFIEQREADSVQRLAPAEAARLFFRSSLDVYARFMRFMEINEIRRIKIALADNAIAMARFIPCYKLQISLAGEFWRLVEDVLANDL